MSAKGMGGATNLSMDAGYYNPKNNIYQSSTALTNSIDRSNLEVNLG